MNNKTEINKKSLVIIGGGFAGSTLAKKLESSLPDNWDLYLLSETNFITFNPLLPEVVGASILPGHVQAPIRQMLNRTLIRMVTVDKVDVEQKKIYYHDQQEANEIQYDQLVFAAGVRANLSMVNGMQEHSLPLKTVGDAVFIRNTIVERLEQATINPDPMRRKELTTFVIIGGGFSGVETAGELEDFLKAANKYYKNVKYEDCKVILLHGTERLLPELSEKLGRQTEKLFARRNIDVRLNTKAVRIERERVILANGEIIAGATIISTIGTTPHHFTQNEQLPINRGKICVEADMSVVNNNELWALGDCAIVPNNYNDTISPPTAQFADRQARLLAKNIVRKLKGKATENFSYRPMGMLASIGHNKAVAEIFNIRISGFIAFLIWRGVYLLKVPTLARKVRLFLEWTWAMFFPPDISHLGFIRSKRDDKD